jgi:F0F1-type ATP synthase membrane subunit a
MWDWIKFTYSKANWDAISAIATFLALVAAVWALFLSRRATQVQVFESIFKDIRELEATYFQAYSGQSEEKKRQWATLFFNTLEYFAFLLNRKMLPAQIFLEFYKPAFLKWYEMFLAFASNHEKNDPNIYPEFKKLVMRFK